METIKISKEGSRGCEEEAKLLAHCVLQPSLVKLLNCDFKYSTLSNELSAALKNRKRERHTCIVDQMFTGLAPQKVEPRNHTSLRNSFEDGEKGHHQLGTIVPLAVC